VRQRCIYFGARRASGSGIQSLSTCTIGRSFNPGKAPTSGLFPVTKRRDLHGSSNTHTGAIVRTQYAVVSRYGANEHIRPQCPQKFYNLLHGGHPRSHPPATLLSMLLDETAKGLRPSRSEGRNSLLFWSNHSSSTTTTLQFASPLMISSADHWLFEWILADIHRHTIPPRQR